jgi:putative membrane protein
MPDWAAWDCEPLLVDLIVLAGWFYAIVAGPLRARLAPGEPWPRRAAVRFFSGLVLFYLTVGAPWERVGRDYLLSAALIGHLVIVYGVAGLLLSGLPPWLVDLPLARRPSAIRSALVHPVVCGALFVLGLTASYLPRVYEWALATGERRALQHVVFLILGLLFWRPILSPSRFLPPLRVGPRLAYLFAIEVALTGVFSFILMAEHPMYPTYVVAPRLIAGLSAEDDQILSGILLSAVSSLVLVGALGSAFFAWARQARASASGS